jgi:tRNA modification GTPase
MSASPPPDSNPQPTCALLTPPGVGAIAVIRVGGGGSAWAVARACIQPRRGSLPDAPDSNRAYYGDFVADGEVVDDVVVAPRPVGDDSVGCVDICCHGGRRVIERILAALAGAGVAVRAPGRLGAGRTCTTDWAERLRGLADACAARTTTHRGALYLLGQRQLLPARIGEILAEADAGRTDAAREGLSRLLDASAAAHRFHQPAEVAIVGSANVGKSSLANRLAGRAGALVADLPGTTRDWVTVDAVLDGVPVTLIDTAGDRAGGDGLEQTAIRAGRARTRDVDLRIRVVAGTDSPTPGSEGLQQTGHLCDILVFNKAELTHSAEAIDRHNDGRDSGLLISAHTGAGLDRLRAIMLKRLGVGDSDPYDAQPAVFVPDLRDRLERLCADHALISGRFAAEIRGAVGAESA